MTDSAEQMKQARMERFLKGQDWKHGDVSHREYPSYEAYLEHQAAKLKNIQGTLEGKAEATIDMFRRRFELLPLKPAASVLCLGARLGHEVMAFLSLGHFALGIDLNPGPNNKYVTVGDFHHLVQADRSVDCVYMNSMDHIYDIEAFCTEVRRVLKPGGFFAADIVYGYEEGFWAGEFEVIHWPTARSFAEKLASTGRFTIESFRDLKYQWYQCVLRPE